MPFDPYNQQAQQPTPLDQQFAAQRAENERKKAEMAAQAQQDMARRQQADQAAHSPQTQASAALTNAQASQLRPSVSPILSAPSVQIGGGVYPTAKPMGTVPRGVAGTNPSDDHMSNGLPPVTQPAYEQQLQTQLEGNIGAQSQSAAAQAALEQLKAQFGGQTELQTLQGNQATGLQAGQFAGQGQLSAQEAAQQAAALNQRAQLSDTGFNTRLQAIQGLIGSGPGGPMLTEPQPGMGGNEQAARDSAFAREKDKLGLIGRGSLTSLQGLMQQRGMAGSGEEMQGMQNILGGVQGGLGDVAREQTLQDLQRSQQVADRDYSGGLTKRGQDLNYKQALLQLLNSGPLY